MNKIRKSRLMIFTSVFLLLTTLGAQFVMSSAADPAIINVPKDYPTIQAAINAASPGDIINVSSGTYFEHVVINKSLTLMGENRDTTIIDGNGTETVIRVDSNDVAISSFTIRNGGTTYDNSGIYIGFYNSCIISGNTIIDNWAGILLFGSESNTIIDNTIESNYKGIEIFFAGGNNTINGNTIDSNYWYGIYIVYSSNNSICHNSFINNRNQTYSTGSINIWDNGYPSGGNYWSDYAGVDLYSGPYQNKPGSDGIGDTQYTIYSTTAENLDRYPLITIKIIKLGQFYRFGVVWESKNCYVDIISNSTVEEFLFSHSDKQISFNVTGPPGTSGFCNVTIPKALLLANETHPWQVLLDSSPIDYTKAENETHTSLYFTYTHTTHHIQIIGTWVTPEFPPALILPLLIITALALTILRKMAQSTKKPTSLRQH